MKKFLSIILMGILSSTAWGEVSQRLVFDLNGPGPELIAAIKKGNALQEKINPGVRNELWFNTIHGPNVGSASLIITYRDLAHYAEALANQEANSEWGEFLENFPGDKFPITFSGLSQVVIDSGAAQATDGSVLAILVFNTGGDTAGFAAEVGKAKALQGRINPDAAIGLVVPTLAGDATGSAVVLTRYASMTDWAEGGAKLQASKEWGEFLASFPADKYPIVYQGLSTAASVD